MPRRAVPRPGSRACSTRRPSPSATRRPRACPRGAGPTSCTPTQALTLGLINSRSYQLQIEGVYLAALDVTLARWNFAPQFSAGLTPGGTSAGGLLSNFPNSYLYRTQEVLGGQASQLNFGTAAGVGKIFSFGGRLVANFANQVAFNFTGANPVQPTVQSILPLSFVQPFLRGGGRAVTLEPLTLAERNLLYTVRNFARFRQTFFPSVLTSRSPATTFAGGGGGGDPTVGFLAVLQLLQVVENSTKTVAAFEQLLKGYQEMAEGGGSGVSQTQRRSDRTQSPEPATEPVARPDCLPKLARSI